MNKAKLHILGMAIGLNRDHEIFEGVAFDEEMAHLLQNDSKITKEDIFLPAPNGKSIFEYKETWDNFSKLMAMLDKDGQTIHFEDLAKPIKNDRSALDMAIACDSISALFTPSLWRGKLEAFEEFYFSLLRTKRGSTDFYDLRDRIAELDGIKTRTISLKEMGITAENIRMAFNSGSLSNLLSTLHMHGDHLRVEDLKLLDIDGDNVMHSKASWEKFEEIFAALDGAGEVLDVDTLTFKCGERNSIIEAAFNHDMQHKIFNANVFKGRPEALMDLYDSISGVHQNKVNIEQILMEVIESQIDKASFSYADIVLDDLLRPLFNHAAAQKISTLNALGLQKTWEHMDNIVKNLHAKGQYIPLDALRGGDDIHDDCLIKAAKFEQFDKVMNIMKYSGERLTADDLLKKAEGSATLLEILEEKGGLEKLLDASYWTGHADELVNIVWVNLSQDSKEKYQDNFRSLLTQCNIQTLRQGHAAAP